MSGLGKLIWQRPQPYSADAVEEFMRRARGGPIVHRGGEPENTLAAIRHAKAENAIGVEIDIMLTKDDHCVLLHDETVDRTSNGRGKVRENTLEELQHFDFGDGERIATLEEAVDLCEELDLIVFLDVKPFITKTDIQKLLCIFEGRPELYSRVCIISYYITALQTLRCLDPKVHCGLGIYCNSLMETVDGHQRTIWWADLLSPLVDWMLFQSLRSFLLDRVGVKLILFCKDDILTNRVAVERWRRGGRSIMAWTVNSNKEKQYFEQRGIPFLTDSAVDEKEEAWVPPERKMTLSNIAQTFWSILHYFLGQH
jgi:glycerophosphoryl diester phosphodiesterase